LRGNGPEHDEPWFHTQNLRGCENCEPQASFTMHGRVNCRPDSESAHNGRSPFARSVWMNSENSVLNEPHVQVELQLVVTTVVLQPLQLVAIFPRPLKIFLNADHQICLIGLNFRTTVVQRPPQGAVSPLFPRGPSINSGSLLVSRTLQWRARLGQSRTLAWDRRRSARVSRALFNQTSFQEWPSKATPISGVLTPRAASVDSMKAAFTPHESRECGKIGRLQNPR
jgi:hypothetical protein